MNELLQDGTLAEDRETYGVICIKANGRCVTAQLSSATASFPITVPQRDQYGRIQAPGEHEYHTLAEAQVAANTWLDNLDATGREVIDGRDFPLTDAQELAVYRKWEHAPDGCTYDELRARVIPELAGYGAVMLPWCNMWLGIETDGYTHS
jgi:hypothetical protein